MKQISLKPHQKLNELSDSLLIIDMQERFLPKNINHNNELYTLARRRLINNILNRADQYIKNGKQVVLVEFMNSGETIDEINGEIGNNALKIKKATQDVTICKGNEDNHNLQKLANNGINIELSGISASCCVLKSNFGLMLNGFNTRIRINCILNYLGTPNSLTQKNTLGSIFEDYSKYYHVNLDKELDISYSIDFMESDPKKNKDDFVWNIF